MKFTVQLALGFCLLSFATLVLSSDEDIIITVKRQNNRCEHSESGTGSWKAAGKTGTSAYNCDIHSCCDEVKSLKDEMQRFSVAFKENRIGLCGAGTKDEYRVKDSQLSESSYAQHSVDYSAKQGRLFNVLEAQAWCAGSSPDKWMQLDLEHDKTVFGVVTQDISWKYRQKNIGCQ